MLIPPLGGLTPSIRCLCVKSFGLHIHQTCYQRYRQADHPPAVVQSSYSRDGCGLQWPLWWPETCYNKNAFIALQTPVMGTQVLLLVSAAKWAMRLHTAGEVWYLRLPCYWPAYTLCRRARLVMVAGVCRRLSLSITPAHMQRNSPGGSTRRRASSVTSR